LSMHACLSASYGSLLPDAVEEVVAAVVVAALDVALVVAADEELGAPPDEETDTVCPEDEVGAPPAPPLPPPCTIRSSAPVIRLHPARVAIRKVKGSAFFAGTSPSYAAGKRGQSLRCSRRLPGHDGAHLTRRCV